MSEYRVRLGDDDLWHVDYHHGIYAETVATWETEDQALDYAREVQRSE